MPGITECQTFTRSLLTKTITAMFVGGTNGIGASMAIKLASIVRKPHIILVGRSQSSADMMLEKLQKVNSLGEYEFHPLDCTLLRPVPDFVKSLNIKSLDYLVLSCGILTMAGRTETSEGIDRKLALHCYVRYKFITACQNIFSPDAKIYSVLDAANAKGDLLADDMALKKHYSLREAANAAINYTDMGFEYLAEKYPNLTFTHAFPGIVDTNIVHSFNKFLTVPMMFALRTLGISVSPDVCAEYMIYGLTYYGPGFFLIDNHANERQRSRYHTPENRKLVIKHLNDVIEEKL